MARQRDDDAECEDVSTCTQQPCPLSGEEGDS